VWSTKEGKKQEEKTLEEQQKMQKWVKVKEAL